MAAAIATEAAIGTAMIIGLKRVSFDAVECDVDGVEPLGEGANVVGVLFACL